MFSTSRCSFLSPASKPSALLRAHRTHLCASFGDWDHSLWPLVFQIWWPQFLPVREPRVSALEAHENDLSAPPTEPGLLPPQPPHGSMSPGSPTTPLPREQCPFLFSPGFCSTEPYKTSTPSLRSSDSSALGQEGSGGSWSLETLILPKLTFLKSGGEGKVQGGKRSVR